MSDLSCPRCDGTGVISAEDWTVSDANAQDPRPAATEAAMSNKDLISAMLAYQQDADNATESSICIPFLEKRDACYAELMRRLAAAPPSGQVAFTDDEWTCVLAALKITVATCGATDCSDCRTLKSAIDKIPAARKGAAR